MVPVRTAHRSRVVGTFLAGIHKFRGSALLPALPTKKEKDITIYMNRDHVLGRKHNRLAGRKGAMLFFRRLINLDYERHCGLCIL